MSHLDERTLARFSQGLLPTEELRLVIRHVNECPECRTRAEGTTGAGTLSITVPGEPFGADTQELSTGSRVQAIAASLDRGSSLGRYVVLEKLGEGGMGVVYAAYDPDLDRKVALKLLRSGLSSAEGVEKRARLLREAQAMARLSHPNVIIVYDVGTLGDQVFVAMEFVDGTTLGEWLRKGPHPWRDVLSICSRAGRGLAAAHAAGIIHRDFKPDNVLIGKDGRVRVTDFGLARPTLPTDEAPLTPGGGPGHLLETPLTLPGVLLGTPAYMAPEQLERKDADARSDQFAFCVALYEALYGLRPFAGRGVSELKPNVLGGRVRPPPADSQVPAFVRKAVFKGLSVNPGDRFPSMDALLATLARDPRGVWRRWGTAAALALVGLGVGGVTVARLRATPVCQGAEAKLVGTWDAPRKEAIRAAFLSTRKPYAHASFDAVTRALDEYARTWIAGHTDACEATHLRREQTEATLELRMLCLDRRRQELDALTSLFTKADAHLVEKAVQASRSLTPVTGCADPTTLTSRTLRPEDPATRQRVEEVRQKLARAKALSDAGRYPEGLALALEALEAARALRFRPLEAEAYLEVGDLQSLNDDPKAAAASLTEAVLAATAGQHAEVAARAWTRLVAVESELDPTRAHLYGRHAAAALEGWRRDDALESRLLSNIGTVYYRQGDYKQAKDHYRRALDLAEKTFSPEHPALAASYNNYANVLDLLGELDEALAYNERALALKEKSLGADHPAVARSLGNVSIILTEMGRYEEARESLARALTIFERSVGEGPRVAITLNSLGDVLVAEGRYPEAERHYERALEIWRKRGSGESIEAAFTLANLGSARVHQGRTGQGLQDLRDAIALVEKQQGRDFPELSAMLMAQAEGLTAERRMPEAHAALARALDIAEEKFGPESLRAGEVHHGLGRVLAAQGRPREALDHLQRSLTFAERAMGSRYHRLGEILTGVGGCHLAMGAPAKAIPPLERALDLLERHPGDPAVLARARFTLARALWDAKQDRARARALAASAREPFARAGEVRRRELAEVSAWLDSHAER